MKNAADFFKNAKAESIEVTGIVRRSNVVNPINMYGYDNYELVLTTDRAGDGGAVFELQDEAKDDELKKLLSETHPGKIFHKALNGPITDGKPGPDKVEIKAHMRRVYRKEDVNVPIYDANGMPGYDIRSARAGKEIETGAKVKAEILLKTYVMHPYDGEEKIVDDNGNVLEVKEVGVTAFLLSVTILYEPSSGFGNKGVSALSEPAA